MKSFLCICLLASVSLGAVVNPPKDITTVGSEFSFPNGTKVSSPSNGVVSIGSGTSAVPVVTEGTINSLLPAVPVYNGDSLSHQGGKP